MNTMSSSSSSVFNRIYFLNAGRGRLTSMERKFLSCSPFCCCCCRKQNKIITFNLLVIDFFNILSTFLLFSISSAVLFDTHEFVGTYLLLVNTCARIPIVISSRKFFLVVVVVIVYSIHRRSKNKNKTKSKERKDLNRGCEERKQKTKKAHTK